MDSTKNSLSKRDFWRGLVMAVLTPVLTILQQIIPSWTDSLSSFLGSMSAAIIAQAAMAAFVSYLAKNFKTDDTASAIKLIEKQGGTVTNNKNNTVTVFKGKLITA